MPPEDHRDLSRRPTVPKSVAGRAGRPPLVNRELIISTARNIPADKLTMKSIADVLGVDRKTLHYYVKDLDSLRELVAFDVFESEFAQANLPADADWRDLLRAVAYALRAALIAVGSLLSYADISGIAGTGVLRRHEGNLRALVHAGFDVEEAGLAYTFISELAYTGAREALNIAEQLARTDTAADPPPDVRNEVSQAAAELPLLSQLVELRGGSDYHNKQFEFGIETLLVAMDVILARRESRGAT